MRNRRQSERGGFTLIEIVIAVAIVAIFAAAISPMVFRHLEDAKISKAQTESEIIATALLSYYKDVGAWTYTNTDGPTGNAVDRVVSYSVSATGAGAGAGTGAASWGTEVPVKSLGDYLYFNNADDDSTEANADEPGEDWPLTGNGAWKGPYLDTYDFPDPWGNAYVINATYFPGGNYTGAVRHKVFVLSAGPNCTWETAWDDATTEEILGDDIGAVVTIR